jgi:hypothetical protein
MAIFINGTIFRTRESEHTLIRKVNEVSSRYMYMYIMKVAYEI